MSGLFDLSGKTAVVIGAASGIGEAIAAGFAKQKARVIAFDIHPDPGRNIAALDITDEQAVDRGIAVLECPFVWRPLVEGAAQGSTLGGSVLKSAGYLARSWARGLAGPRPCAPSVSPIR